MQEDSFAVEKIVRRTSYSKGHLKMDLFLHVGGQYLVGGP